MSRSTASRHGLPRRRSTRVRGHAPTTLRDRCLFSADQVRWLLVDRLLRRDQLLKVLIKSPQASSRLPC